MCARFLQRGDSLMVQPWDGSPQPRIKQVQPRRLIFFHEHAHEDGSSSIGGRREHAALNLKLPQEREKNYRPVERAAKAAPQYEGGG